MPVRLFAAAVLLLAVVWIAWPYGRLWSFAQAVDAGERTRLERAVDWPSVRGHLKADVRGALAQEFTGSGDPEDPGEVLARRALLLLSQAVAEGLIETYATPGALLAILREIAEAGEGEGRFLDTVTYAFFASPVEFQVRAKPEGGTGEPLVLVFTFRDFGWVVTRLGLPLEELKGGISGDGPGKEERRP